ncbi:MAG: hypothetical protein ACI4KG_00610 [Oscillospiraceae bacterium]
MKMICPNCGKEYNEKMTCCISCGADLVPYEQASEQTVFEPLIPENVPESSSEAEKNESSEFVRKLPEKPFSADKDIAVPVIKKKKVLSVSGAARFTGSLITAFFMFAFILMSASAAALRLITDNENIAAFADRIDIMSLPASQTVITDGRYAVDDGATVQEAIYVMSQGTGLTREDIRTIYEASTIRDFLTSQLTGYAEFIRSGKIPEKLTSEKLKGVFSENLGLIDNAMGKPLSQHDIDLAFSEIDRLQPKLDKLSASNFEAAVGENGLAAVRLFSSVPFIVSAAALAAAMLPLLRAINKRGTRTLAWGGGAVLSGGAVILAATFLFSVQFPFSGQDRLVRNLAKCAADVISPDLYRIGCSLAVLGAVMLIWAASLRKSVSLV